jgi:hypothetical protein
MISFEGLVKGMISFEGLVKLISYLHDSPGLLFAIWVTPLIGAVAVELEPSGLGPLSAVLRSKPIQQRSPWIDLCVACQRRTNLSLFRRINLSPFLRREMSLV